MLSDNDLLQVMLMRGTTSIPDANCPHADAEGGETGNAEASIPDLGKPMAEDGETDAREE